MLHTVAFYDQFPVTAYITSLILYYPLETADVQERLLTTDREILNY